MAVIWILWTARLKADKTIASYRRMRTQPLWRLLASDNGPVVLGILQTHLYENDRSLPASILYERIGRDLEALRSRGGDFPMNAQAYVSGWLAEGFLTRNLPPGADEEVYELSTAAAEAIRIVSGLEKPHSAATESRLAIVMQELVNLADETDTDSSQRIKNLMADQVKIAEKIEDIRQGRMYVTPPEKALEKIREIISLVDDVNGDFRRIRDQFEQLNRDLRERIMDNEGSRGEVLDSLFAGIDLIADSPAGRTFTAFWNLLNDQVQKTTLEQALEILIGRDFAKQMNPEEIRFLKRMTRNLLNQSRDVHDVMRTFARSLNHFVQSHEYLEQRRLTRLIKNSQNAALAIKDETRAAALLDYHLILTSSRVRSLSQMTPYDPSLRAPPGGMNAGGIPSIDLETVGKLVAQSEIDFRSLKTDVLETLETRSPVSIGDILELHPAAQGLGSVIGLIALGCRYGNKSDESETVTWTGGDSVRRSARIIKMLFSREKVNEFA